MAHLLFTPIASAAVTPRWAVTRFIITRSTYANTAIGYGALFNNGGDFGTAGGNTAIGFEALYNNTTGNTNIALGGYAGWNRTTGDYNIDIGNAGVAGESNTIRIGDESDHSATFIAGISGQDALLAAYGVIRREQRKARHGQRSIVSAFQG